MREINARGGVLGHRLELLVRDDRDNPATGVARARELVERDHVKFLAGTCSSPVGKSVEQLVANPDHVVYVAGLADPSIFEVGPESYVFGTIPTAAQEGRFAAAYMRRHPRWKRIALISEDYSYGYQVTSAFRKAMRGSGQEIVGASFVPSGEGDYSSFVRTLLAERPDAVYSTLVTGDAVTFVRDALPAGLFTRTHFFGVMDYGTLASMERAPEGAVGYTVYPSAALYRTAFAAELRTLGPTVANSGAAGDGFNQVEVIAQGVEKAGSTDAEKVRNILGKAKVDLVQGVLGVSRRHWSAIRATTSG